MGNDFAALSSVAKEMLNRHERRTDYTRQRLVAISMLGRAHNPELTALLVLNCDRRTAQRFVEQVRMRGLGAAFHGNLERRTHEQAFQMLRDAIAGLPRGAKVSSPKVVRWLNAQGIAAPCERVVRWWLREVFGRKRRRSGRRRVGL